MSKQTLKLQVAVVAIVLAFLTTAGYAQDVSISSGLTWLNAHQNADGSWGALPELAPRDTARVLIARQVVRSIDAQTNAGYGFLRAQQSAAANQFLAEEALAFALAKQNSAPAVAALLAQHAPSGADFGSFVDQSGNTFDSALAVEALSVDEKTYAGMIAPIVTALGLRQNADGGWGIDQGFVSSPVWTAEVLIALGKLKVVHAPDAMISASQRYLLAQAHADGSIGANALETAVSFRAFALTACPYANGAATLAYLRAQQSADGSWGGNAYLTARVLEALASNKPNLVIHLADVSISPSPAQEGVDLNLTYSVSNVGFADAGDNYVAVNDLSATGSELANNYVPPVRAQSKSIGHALLRMSATGTSHTVYLKANSDGRVDELLLDDNITPFTFPVVERPDLEVFASEIVTTPAHPQPGDDVHVTATIHNSGGSESGAFAWTLGDIINAQAEAALAGGTLPTIAAGGSAIVTGSFKATSGVHALHLVADSGNVVVERNESNNDVKQPVTVANRSTVDLALLAGSVTTSDAHPQPGAQIAIRAELRNLGSDPVTSSVAFYDGVPGFGGTLIQSFPLTLDAHDRVVVPLTYTVKASTKVIYAVADPDHLVTEIDETNNQAYVAETDQIADIVVEQSDLLMPKQTFTRDRTMTARALIHNRGGVAAQNVEVAIYDDLPQSGGKLLNDTRIDLAAGATVTVPFSWTSRFGQHFATVVVNGQHDAQEIDYTNDRAWKFYAVNGGHDDNPTPSAAIDTSALHVDADTLAVSGSIGVPLGTQRLTPFSVSVFEDVDGDRVFNPEVDNQLGSVVVSPVTNLNNISIPVAGYVRYTPARLMLYVDTTNVLEEYDETNNFFDVYPSKCATSARTFTPSVKWRVPGIQDSRLSAVARLVDTNGDGLIDDYDAPAVVAVEGSNVIAIRGDTGAVLWTKSSGTQRQSNPAIGDVDGDGKPDVIAHADLHRIVCLDGSTGAVKWTSPELPIDAGWTYLQSNFSWAGAPVIADLNGDGHPAVIAGSVVLDGGTGQIRWIGSGGSGRAFPSTPGVDYYNEAFPDQQAPIAADIDGDGKLEVVAGNTVYRADGSILWQRSDLPDGYTAMYRNNICLVGGGKVYMLKPDGTDLWPAPVTIPGGAIIGGAPTVLFTERYSRGPLIGVAGDGTYTAIYADSGNVLWQRSVTSNLDRQSNTVTNAASAFKFDNDFVAFVYMSNQRLTILDGGDGSLLYQEDIGTARPWVGGVPSIADVDGDGHADIVVGGSNGLHVISDPTWNSAPSIFNEASYHVINVASESGAIPQHEVGTSDSRYMFRAQSSGAPAAVLRSDLAASYPRIDARNVPRSVDLTVRLANVGTAAAPASTVGFYSSSASGNTKLGTVAVPPLAAGAWTDVTFSYQQPVSGQFAFFGRANDGTVLLDDCDAANDASSIATLTLTRDIIALANSIVASDAKPRQTDTISILASAELRGAIDPALPLHAQLYLGDPASGGVALGAPVLASVATAHATPIASVAINWTVDAPVGTQRLFVVFNSDHSISEDDLTNDVVSTLIEVTSSTPDRRLSAATTLDPAAVEPGGTVAIRTLVQNAGNVALDAQTLDWTATGTHGQQFRGSATLAALAKNGVAEVQLGTFVAADQDTYGVTVAAHDPAVTLTGGAATISVAPFAGVALTAIPARVPLTLPLVQCHARISRTNTLAVSTDPLVAMIKAHMSQGVSWAVNYVKNDTTGAATCYACHIHSGALINAETAARVAGVSVDKSFLDMLFQRIAGYLATPEGLTNELASHVAPFGLLAYHDAAAAAAPLAASMDVLLTTQQQDGSFLYRYNVWSPGFDTTAAQSMVAAGDLAGAYERTGDARYRAAMNREAAWLLAFPYTEPQMRMVEDAARVGTALLSVRPYIDDAAMAADIPGRLAAIDAFLRNQQNADGSFGTAANDGRTVTRSAQCLTFLTRNGATLRDPAVRNAALWLMNVQKGAGFWTDAAPNSGPPPTQVDWNRTVEATNWVLIALPDLLAQDHAFAPELHLTLPSSTTVTAGPVMPVAQRAVANGTEYTWRVTEPSDSGTDIYFNLKLSGLQNEVPAPVASAASISYDDPYTHAAVSHDVAVPTVTGFAPVAVTLASDKTAYGANAPVTLTEAIRNVATNGSNVTNTVAIRDANGTTIATLAANEAVTGMTATPFPGWHAAAAVSAATGSGTNRIAQFSVDFAQLLQSAGMAGSFDTNSIRVSADAAPSQELHYTWAPGSVATSGQLVVSLPDGAASPVALHIYFDTNENGFKPASAYNRALVPSGDGVTWSAYTIDTNSTPFNPQRVSDIVTVQPALASGTQAFVGIPLEFANSAPSKLLVVERSSILLAQSGTYTFELGADYGVWIKVDGVDRLSVISNWTVPQLSLSAGFHTIEMSYYRNGPAFWMSLQMQGPGMPWAPLPASLLYTAGGPLASTTVTAAQALSSDAGSSRTYVWNSGVAAAGTYTATATVRQDGGVVGGAAATFTIGRAATVAATVTTNAAAYDAGQTAHVATTLDYSSGNVVLSNVTVTISVTDPTGAVVASAPTTFATVTPGQLLHPSLDYTIASSAVAGTYSAHVVVKDASNNTLADTSAPFTVRASSSNGKGISGTLTANPTVVQTSPLGMAVTLTNGGNSALTNAPFRIDVLDAAGASVTALPFTATIDVAASVSKQLTLDTTPLTPGSYTLFLVSLTGSTPQSLAHSVLTVVAAPSVTVSSTTDKPAYDLGDVAHVTSTIAYVSGSAALTNINVLITIADASGNVVQTKNSTIASLAPGSSATASLDQSITNALAPGTYTIKVAIADANGVVLANGSSTFTINSTAATGSFITGTINTPASVMQNQPLAIALSLTNGGNAALTNGAFNVQLLDAAATVVATLDTTASIGVGATTTQTLIYDTAARAPGSYAARLVSNITSTPKTLATTSFTIATIPTVLTATASADKASYDLGDTAHVTSTITYVSGPAPLTNTNVSITITDANGAVVQTKSSTTASLALGSNASTSLDQAITNALAPGTYTIKTAVADANGAVLANGSSTFTISSTASNGKGISGTIATPATLQQNQPLAVALSVTNNGNAPLTSAPFAVQIVDSASNVVGTLNTNVAAAIGATATQTLTFDTTALAPATYSARLISNITATTQTLASSTFSIVAIPAVITATTSTDKASYDLGDTVHLTSTIAYSSGSAPLTNTNVLITITDASGNVIQTKSSTIASLAQGSSATVSLDQSITNALAPGTYTVKVAVTDASGVPLANGSSTFAITSTAVTGAAINGTIATPATLQQNQPLAISLTLTNGGNASLTNAAFSVQLLDSSSGVAATLSTTATIAVGATATQTLTANTTALAPGSYSARLVSNITSTPKTLATASFTITTLPTTVTATTSTDKTSYDLGDTAHVTSTITYVSGPASLTNANVAITIRDASGNVVQTKTSTITSLAPGSSATTSLDQSITNALAPGTYTITTAVTDANGVAVANNSSTFTITSTATTGSGITGTITTPATVQQGASLSININIANDGNAPLANAQFAVQLVDGATVVATLPFTVSVANGTSATKTLAYDTTGLAPKSYTLRLVSNITTTPRTLAISNSTVMSATQLSLSIATSSTPRVLIFSSCSSGNSSKGCTAVTPAFLTSSLTAAGISWNVVGDEDSFLAAMRSGGYSAAIIDQPKSAELKIADEYLAIVHAGFGLLFIDNDPNAMPKLSPALQTTFGGKLHGPTLLDTAATPFTSVGTLTLNGDTTALQLAGATPAARIKSTQAPAITYAAYGSGRVVVLPFDVESTPTTDVAKLVTNATSYVSRVPSHDARQVVPVALDVTTPAGGGALNLELTLTLPDGMSVVAISPQSSPATSAHWTFTAQAGTTSRFIVWLRLPETEGSYVVNAALGFTGQLPLVTKQLTLDVTAARTALETTLSTQLAALQSHATAKEQKSITDMQAKLDASRASATPDAATAAANITRMLDILDGLTALSLDTTNARAGAERLLMYWQSRS